MGGSRTKWVPSSSTTTPPCASQPRRARGPERTAAFARHSASTAVGASAVAWTTPVKAGRPVAGSSRWCAGRPSAPSQLRRPMPLVAAAAVSSSKTCTGLPPNGSAISSRRVGPAKRRSPPQSTAKLGVPREPFGDQVGEQALGESAAVEADAARAPDLPAVDGDLRPAGMRIRRGGTTLRGESQRQAQRQRGGEVADVARGLDLAEQRAVDEAAGGPRGLAHDLDQAGHRRADGHHLARVGVQARQLRRREEAAEADVPALQAAPGVVLGLRGGPDAAA